MLQLRSPDLPTSDQGYVVEQNRIIQLYSDLDNRGVAGVIAQIRRSQEGEVAYLGRPIGKGYFYPLTFAKEFTSFALSAYEEVLRPSSLKGNSFWRRNSEVGIYSRSVLPGSVFFAVTATEYYRDLSSSLDVKISTDVDPSMVSSLGYTYQPGAGVDQWAYTAPTLTIHTSLSSQIQPNQAIAVAGYYEVAIAAPTLQIISYQVEKDDLITGVDMFGRSFTPAWNNYSPKDGEFTLSTDGLLNLYVSMEVLLPNVGAATVHQRIINTGTLTYSRLAA